MLGCAKYWIESTWSGGRLSIASYTHKSNYRYGIPLLVEMVAVIAAATSIVVVVVVVVIVVIVAVIVLLLLVVVIVTVELITIAVVSSNIGRSSNSNISASRSNFSTYYY
jgi:hypothetical protein